MTIINNSNKMTLMISKELRCRAMSVEILSTAAAELYEKFHLKRLAIGE